ncbi:uncharacterized protein [Venturia canescens]|uniref:uncharacterized protein n=1 Tax=Venturia canescens TaxID=32260 RepID=UPI001C9D0E08|nr:uncharacterized protein LOC122414619 [Venturia canescens]XP_043281995.1 uncharacterized protein LOC122414619 [Venturia canescens]XP_043281996.1 uncharacterized protein LOC122414619 [Venturia canescens]XP_043281997.1 uncharacterized protein LOC122414619 [Venturia canescens]XP_043281999.1 uncharacterized protein LOC122414619 [Venturia canescens]XP_043282000.1 uncharacterized protein LOC122414619 [Venturia canescens]
MCCTGGTSGSKMTRCGIVCGLAALAALLIALLGPAWLHTEEKLAIPHLERQLPAVVSVRFKLGLFKVCSQIIKPANLTIHLQTPSCTQVRYSSVADVTSQELGFRQLDFTPTVVSKMRISAPFQVVAVALIFAGTFSALVGHCYSDHKTVIACGLFLLGGLSLGGGLIVLASALSDASFESPKRFNLASSSSLQPDDDGLPQYQYGWCLQLSGLALILAEIAALLTVSGYMARFPTVEDMVRVMVPGAERKLREQRGLSSEYLVRAHQKSPGATQGRTFEQPTKDIILGAQRLADEDTSLLCKSAPDICASNPQAISYVDKADMSHLPPCYPDSQPIVDPRFAFGEKADPSVVDSRLSGFADKEGLMDSRILSDSRQNMIAFTDGKEHVLASGQEPRYVEFCGRVEQSTGLNDPRLANYQQESKNVESLLDAPLGYDSRYTLAGQTVPITLKHQSPSVSTMKPQFMYQNFGTIHSGILRVSEPGTSSSSNSSQRSMTLQNPKRKSQIAQNTFSTMECEKRKGKGPGLTGKAGFYTGSAV